MYYNKQQLISKTNSITSYLLETIYLAIFRYKKGHNSSKNCRKIFIIKLDLDIYKIHLHATSSFYLSFHSQVIIWKPIRDTRTKYKKGCNSGKICRKMIAIEIDLDIHEIHLHTKPSFNLTICSQVIIWKPSTRTNGRTDGRHSFL